MRLRHLALTIWLLFPISALAQDNDMCEGKDLIDALPASERQHLDKRVQQTPYPEGLLWRAKRDDITLTIFGTYHLETAQTSEHLEFVKNFITEASDVLLEISPSDMRTLEKEIAANPSLMFQTDGDTLPDLLGPTYWPRYTEEMAARQFPSLLSSQFKPSWAAMMLGISPCEARSGALSGQGIDERIGEHAETLGKAVHSIEDYQTVLKLLDDFPQSEQLDMIRMFLDWPVDADDLAYTLRQAYLGEQIGLIWAFAEMQAEETNTETEFSNFNDLLLTQRNREWIKFIETLDPKNTPVFIAVGAGHLPGETGLLQLLDNAGYQIERLPFTP